MAKADGDLEALKAGQRTLERRLDVVDTKLDALEQRMDRLEQRMERLEQRMDQGFADIRRESDRRFIWLVGLMIVFQSATLGLLARIVGWI